jgi:hypothetical protein
MQSIFSVQNVFRKAFSQNKFYPPQSSSGCRVNFVFELKMEVCYTKKTNDVTSAMLDSSGSFDPFCS